MRKIFIFIFIYTLSFLSLHSFENGAVINVIADVGGSATMPYINKSDLEKIGANKMEGMIGFVVGGEAEIGYIFGAKEYFNLENNNIFSGVGLFGVVGVSEGYAGQISGSSETVDGVEQQVDVFFNIYYSPVITAGITSKVYLFKNRMAIGLHAGVKVIADPQPAYEMYSTEAELFPPEVGTIIVDDWMMKNMNPIMLTLKTMIEYSVPIVDTLEVIMGGYASYDIYTPKHITMPPILLEAAVKNGFNPQDHIKSYYINSLNFGIRVGLGLKL